MISFWLEIFFYKISKEDLRLNILGIFMKRTRMNIKFQLERLAEDEQFFLHSANIADKVKVELIHFSITPSD